MTYIEEQLPWISSNPYLQTAFALAALTLLALIANFIVKKILLRLLGKILKHTALGRDEAISRHNPVARLANIVPALVFIMGIPFVPDMSESLTQIIQNVAKACIILFTALSLVAALDFANALYNRNAKHISHSIKGYVQIGKIALYCVAAILMISTLMDKSPVILLSGLGAMAAVLMLVFQDTLLSFVASIQISSADMIRVGDWIEMPQLNADGAVIDMALHTVKVQNWDKTITTLPTRRLVTEPFKNWRGMFESGGRRIKRALYIDQASIHFLTDAEKAHLKKIRIIRDYLDGKEQEIGEWNAGLGDDANASVNTRRITNIGTFRAYIAHYLRTLPGIHQDMTMMVRQLQPTPEGLPLEIYAFSSNTAWVVYEGIQADIFDHLYSIMPEFGLRAFQNPSGHDFQRII